MTVRPLALISSAAMVGSFFLPWLSGPIGEGTVPWEAFKSLNTTQIQDLLTNLPPEGMAFFASFALAALLALLALLGFAPRILSVVTGGIPMGFLAWALYKATQGAGDTGLPLPSGDLSTVINQSMELMGPGAWGWLGGGALLLLLGLFAPSRR